VSEVRGDAGEQVPAEDGADRVPSRAPDRGRAVPPRPEPPAEYARRIDELLDGLLSYPVTPEDTAEVRAAVLAAWPGCRAEVYSHDRRTVRVAAWLDDYFTGPIVRRSVVAS
jgi:hypothetical protein